MKGDAHQTGRESESISTSGAFSYSHQPCFQMQQEASYSIIAPINSLPAQYQMADRQSKSVAGEEHVKSQIFLLRTKKQTKKTEELIYIYLLARNTTPNEQGCTLKLEKRATAPEPQEPHKPQGHFVEKVCGHLINYYNVWEYGNTLG